MNETVEKRIFCNKCRGETNHIKKGEHNKTFDEFEETTLIYYEKWVYTLWICAGCDTGLLEEAWTSLGMYNENGDEIYERNYFPKREFSQLKYKRYNKLPKNIIPIYIECIKSYNFGLRLLCAGGLRALIEGVCHDKGFNSGVLRTKIDKLKVFLPENIVKSIHGFRFLGNTAMHELEAPDQKTLKTAIDISEDILNILYELDYKMQALPKKK